MMDKIWRVYTLIEVLAPRCFGSLRNRRASGYREHNLWYDEIRERLSIVTHIKRDQNTIRKKTYSGQN